MMSCVRFRYLTKASMQRLLSCVTFVLIIISVALIGLSQGKLMAGRIINAASCSDMVYDDASGILYITSGSQILRYDNASRTFLAPFQTNGKLRGIDLSPDGKTLAVADLSYAGDAYTMQGGTTWFHLIDTTTGNDAEVLINRGYGEGGTYSVAYGSDGNVLITNDFLGSGWTPLRKYDTASKTLTILYSGVRMDSMLSASADRSVIAWEESNESDGPFGRYRVSDGNIIHMDSYEYGTSAFNYTVAANRNGTQYAILYYQSAAICDSNMIKTGYIYGNSSSSPASAVYNPVKDIIYLSNASTSIVSAYDSSNLGKIRDYDVGETFNGGGAYGVGRLKTSADGSLLFAIVPDGISIVRLNNNPPTGVDQSVTTLEDTPAKITLNGSDQDGDKITYNITSNPSHGTLSGTAPNLVYTPAANYNGTDSFVYKINDGDADSAPVAVTISITPVNDAPVANSQTIRINEEDTTNIILSGTDIDGDKLTYSIVDQPKHGILSGTLPNLVYKSNLNYSGSDLFTFKVNDGMVDSAIASVNIIISHVPHVSVGQAKTLSLGSLVFIEKAVVTASNLESGVSFISSPDRSSGIKLLTSNALQPGQTVRLKGILARVNGEWQLSSCTFSNITDGDELAPIYTGNKALCNDPWETLDYEGINMTGSLIRTYGVVTAVIPGSNVIYINDGFSYSDGIGPWIGLRVQFPSGVPLPSKGKKLVINGISRVEKHTLTQWGYINGDWFPEGTIVYVPSVWVRNAGDVQLL